MRYRNPFITASFDKTVVNFTSDFGIKVRRIINKPFRFVLRLATKHKVVIENCYKLDPDKQYIFAATHSFSEDVISALCNIDRSVYVLNGTTHQITYNPQMLALYINGFAYVNRFDVDSRKDAIKKLLRILQSKSSVFLFPEGGWNNSENKLVNPLFAGPWLLAKESGCEVVPWTSFCESGSDTIYIRMGKPMNIALLEKEDAITQLRDTLATDVWLLMEKHATKIVRKEIDMDKARSDFFEERRLEYIIPNYWYEDVWEEELTVYKDKRYPCPEDVWETFSNVVVTNDNCYVMASILKKIIEYDKSDFKKYMHVNWNKTYDKGRKVKNII